MSVQVTIELPEDLWPILRTSPDDFVTEMRLAAAVTVILPIRLDAGQPRCLRTRSSIAPSRISPSSADISVTVRPKSCPSHGPIPNSPRSSMTSTPVNERYHSAFGFNGQSAPCCLPKSLAWCSSCLLRWAMFKPTTCTSVPS